MSIESITRISCIIGIEMGGGLADLAYVVVTRTLYTAAIFSEPSYYASLLHAEIFTDACAYLRGDFINQ